MKHIYYIPDKVPALNYAVEALFRAGCCISDQLSKETTHMILPIPSFGADGNAKFMLPAGEIPSHVTIIGGNLHRMRVGGEKIDLLDDALYQASNAAITARCAVRLVERQVPYTLNQCPILILGWGRIGKCLARILKDLGADITVAARKNSDRAMLLALGYHAADVNGLSDCLPKVRILINTVPAPVLSAEDLAGCREGCLKIELASVNGLEGSDILIGRGLPGKMAPQASGELIAETILRLCENKEA